MRIVAAFSKYAAPLSRVLYSCSSTFLSGAKLLELALLGAGAVDEEEPPALEKLKLKSKSAIFYTYVLCFDLKFLKPK